jgi:hypothetical protein
VPLAKVLTAVAPPPACAVFGELVGAEPGIAPLSAESAPAANGLRRHSLLSVFLI